MINLRQCVKVLREFLQGVPIAARRRVGRLSQHFADFRECHFFPDFQDHNLRLRRGQFSQSPSDVTVNLLFALLGEYIRTRTWSAF